MVFVTSDPHGYRHELSRALQQAGLVDDRENWAGGEETLWILGDLLDRGPDGIGVVSLVHRLTSQAPDSGGRVGLILGNHEVMALGMQRFGRDLIDDEQSLGWMMNWFQNGGHASDQEGLTDEHVAWLSSCPVMVAHDERLLVHSDTTDYLQLGESIDAINAEVASILATDDINAWWELLEKMTSRFDFASEGGGEAASSMTAQLGVDRIVHGHSIIGHLLGIEPTKVTKPLLYADGRVLAIDGGMYAGGPCIVVRLDGWPQPDPVT